MVLVFVSNYINHHQLPFCQALYEKLGTDFHFIQTEPMEEERVRMGWALDITQIPYVTCWYDDKKAAQDLMLSCDILLYGWTEREELLSVIEQRLHENHPVVRVSERIYREGQWKALSPRGLWAKYKEHIRYRKAPCYMLCAGAYVASDFALIHSYPDKMYRFGYFPESVENIGSETERVANARGNHTEDMGQTTERETEHETEHAGKTAGPVEILWAGRFLPLKHPEFALQLAATLQQKKIPFHLTMVGGGEMEEALQQMRTENKLEEVVTFTGFLSPKEVRSYMRQSDVFLFTSNQLEGWGAVLNEAMDSGCAVVAGTLAGGVPYLLQDGENGVLYNGEELADFLEVATNLITDRRKIEAFGQAARKTIQTEWNATEASARFLSFGEAILSHQNYIAPKSGPMSKAPILKPYLKIPR